MSLPQPAVGIIWGRCSLAAPIHIVRLDVEAERTIVSGHCAGVEVDAVIPRDCNSCGRTLDRIVADGHVHLRKVTADSAIGIGFNVDPMLSKLVHPVLINQRREAAGAERFQVNAIRYGSAGAGSIECTDRVAGDRTAKLRVAVGGITCSSTLEDIDRRTATRTGHGVIRYVVIDINPAATPTGNVHALG